MITESQMEVEEFPRQSALDTWSFTIIADGIMDQKICNLHNIYFNGKKCILAALVSKSTDKLQDNFFSTIKVWIWKKRNTLIALVFMRLTNCILIGCNLSNHFHYKYAQRIMWNDKNSSTNMKYMYYNWQFQSQEGI